MKLPVLLGIAGLLVLAGGAFQKREINALRKQIAARRSGLLPATVAGAPERSHRREGPGAGGPDMAGHESLPEAKALVEKLAPLWNGEDGSVQQSLAGEPGQRLGGLLADMGAGTAGMLMEWWKSTAGPEPWIYEGLRQLYSQMNPGQSFLLAEAEPPSQSRDQSLVTSFRCWSISDPAEAMQWYRNALAKGDPRASWPGVRASATVVEARTDPSRALVGIAAEDEPRTREWLLEQCVAALRDHPERRAFLEAVTMAHGDSADESLRATVIKGVSAQLQTEPFGEALALAEGYFTPDEQRELARSRAGIAGLDLPAWSAWMLKLDFPAGVEHPLVTLAVNAGRDASEEARKPGGKVRIPEWLCRLPGGETVNFAMEGFLDTQVAGVAAGIVTQLPPGALRRAMAEKVARRLDSQDAVAEAANFRAGEGIGK